MNRFALRTVTNLVAAAGAVGHHNRIGLLAHGRQQAELGHLHRHLVVAGLIAKAASHAAAARLDQLRLGAGNQLEQDHDGTDRAKRLLVAMAVQQDGFCRGPELAFEQFEFAGG